MIKVLVIEDDNIDQMAFKRLVKKQGLLYDYSIVESISYAKEKLKSENFDVVLVDFNLTDGTAFDILDDIASDIAVILITGGGDEEIAVKAMKKGVSDYLIKGPDSSHLKSLPITVDKAVKHKKAEKELRQYKEKLEEMVRQRTLQLEKANDEIMQTQQQMVHITKIAALGELAAGIVHEINQPLHGMRLIINSIKRDIRKDRLDVELLPEELEEAEKYIVKLAEIVDQLRVYTRFSDQKELIPTNINKVVQSAAKLFRSQLIKKRISFTAELAENIPDIPTIASELEQVIVNLISNAKDALITMKTESEDNAIVLKTYTQNDGKNVVISVKDNAGGVPDDIRDKIFQSFFTTKSAGNGTGLGLSISKKIIKRCNGTLNLVVNKPNSTFIITLSNEKKIG